MPIVIHDDRINRLAEEIACRTGKTVAQIVAEALEERLMREQAAAAAVERLATLTALVANFRGVASPHLKSQDHATILYGDGGLPE